MDIKNAEKILNILLENDKDKDFIMLRDQLLKDAVDYANIRAKWYF